MSLQLENTIKQHISILINIIYLISKDYPIFNFKQLCPPLRISEFLKKKLINYYFK